MPVSNENAIEYTNEKIKQLIDGLNKYFKKENESTGFSRNYLFDDQIKDELLHTIYDLDSSLNKIKDNQN